MKLFMQPETTKKKKQFVKIITAKGNKNNNTPHKKHFQQTRRPHKHKLLSTNTLLKTQTGNGNLMQCCFVYKQYNK